MVNSSLVFVRESCFMFLLVVWIAPQTIFSQDMKNDSISQKKIEIDYTDKGFQFKTAEYYYLLESKS